MDPDQLAASSRRLTARTPSRHGVVAALEEVTAACVEIFDVDGSGVMLADDRDVHRYVTASDVPGKALETAESDAGEGPCTQAYVEGVVVATPDLLADPRWPVLAQRLRGAGVRAVLGVPVRLGGVLVGTLDVYRDRPGPWGAEEHRALERYGEVVGTTLAAALAAQDAGALAAQLQYALDHRVVVERGVGYLMAKEGLDAVAAFDRLRSAARAGRRRTGDVATDLLVSGTLARPAPS